MKDSRSRGVPLCTLSFRASVKEAQPSKEQMALEED